MSERSDSYLIEGTVIEVLPNMLFRAELANGHRMLSHLSGELRLNFIKLLPGSKVLLEIHPYDLSRGRIVELRS